MAGRKKETPAIKASELESLSSGDSGAIDLAEIERLAKDADRLATQDPPEKKARRKKTAEPAPEQQAKKEEPRVPIDPEFQMMIHWGVAMAADECGKRLGWADPGLHWKEKVSAILARMVERIQPMEPGPWTDLATLIGYLGLWVIPNVGVNALFAPGENPGSTGNDGKRKDV